MKMIITGNSGSGKTWLAGHLSRIYDAPMIHYDDIFWEPGGFDRKRKPGEVLALIEKSKASSSWIAEGVFGKIVEHYLADADIFIWLDIPLEICVERLKCRGSESKTHMNREETEEGLNDLIEWASHYYHRNNLNSYSGHRKLFDDFSKKKFRLCSESDVARFMEIIKRV